MSNSRMTVPADAPFVCTPMIWLVTLRRNRLRPWLPTYATVVDNPLVIPVGANIRVLTTGHDVIHSFFVPSLGVQKYTIPGRTLETWFRADREGTFYGQCNQICGNNHWFMPIMVRAVPQAEFQAWAEAAKTKYAAAGAPPALAAAAEPATAQQLAEARR